MLLNWNYHPVQIFVRDFLTILADKLKEEQSMYLHLRSKFDCFQAKRHMGLKLTKQAINCPIFDILLLTCQRYIFRNIIYEKLFTALPICKKLWLQDFLCGPSNLARK